jgi:hypothetical protein
MNEPIVQRDAQGRFLKGSTGAVLRGKPGTRLADLIKRKFSTEMEVYLGDKLTRMERKEIMADTLAQLISTGEVRFPDRPDPEKPGEIIKGKVFKYNSEEWIRQIIRLMRYIEPPVQEIEISGGVQGVVFDNEFLEQVDIQPEPEGEQYDR